MRILLGVLLYVSLAAGLAPAGPPAPSPKKAGGGEPIACRQNVFSIPFRVNRAPDAPDAPVEMQLFVSVDRGANWHLASRSNPRESGFNFRAPGDAEYWFSLRSVDRQGQLHPTVPHAPELKVIVDTLPPRLELRPSPGPAGELEIQWLAEDSFLLPSTLRIEYQTAPDQPWQQLAIGQPEQNAPQTRRAGRSTWMPAEHSGKTVIRAEVADGAGNRTVTLAPVDLARLAAGPSTAPNTAGGPQDNNPIREASLPSPVGGRHASVGLEPAQDATGSMQPWPADHLSRKPLHYQNGSGRPSASADTAMPENQAMPESQKSHQVDPQIVQGSKFQLGYNVPAGAAGPVAKVEVWGTYDRGRTWQLYAVDSDKESPAAVQVRQPGVYGFSVVVQDSAGAGGTPPRPGQPPDTWIRVILPAPPQTR